MKDRECVQCGSVVQVLSADLSFCLDCDWDDMPVLDVSGQDGQSDSPEYLVNHGGVLDREQCLALISVPLENRVEVLVMLEDCRELEEGVERMRMYMSDDPFALYAYIAASRWGGTFLDDCGMMQGLKREPDENDSVFRSRILSKIRQKYEREKRVMRVIRDGMGR